MTRTSIEIVIGRLVTDEDFRAGFLLDPHQALTELFDLGVHLTHREIAGLIATDPVLWATAAAHIDSRLQKASLKT